MLTRATFIQAVVFIVFSIILAALLPVVPLGVYSRLLAFVLVLSILVAFWVMRHDNNHYPEKLLHALICILILFSIIWPRYVFYKFGPLPRVNPYSITQFITIFLILISLVYSPVLSKRIGSVVSASKLCVYIIVAWLVWRLFASVLGQNSIGSLVVYFRELIYICSFFLVGMVFMTYPRAEITLTRILLFGGLIVAMGGIYESVTASNPFVGMASQDEDGAIFDTLKNIAHDKSRDGVYRAQSVFGHPIVFAQFLAAILPIVIFIFFNDKSRFWRLIALLYIPLMLIAIIKSGARSGFVGVIVGISVMGFVLWLKCIRSGYLSRVIAILSVPIIAISVVFGIYFVSSLIAGQSALEANSGTVRMIMFNNAVRALYDSPLIGYGDGMAAEIAGLVSTTGVMTIDNYFLNIAVDGGYVGLSLFLCLIGFIIVSVIGLIIKVKGVSCFYATAVLASIISLLSVFAIVSIAENFTLLWLLVASVFGILSRDAKSKSLQGAMFVENELNE